MRRAAKVDANQAEIVKALRAIGATVYNIKEPVDLLVGFRRKTIALEVKKPGDYKLTPQQRQFFATFNGEAYIVQGVADALKAVQNALGRKETA